MFSTRDYRMISVAQMCSRASVAQNLKECARAVELAKAQGSRLLYFPEAADFIAEKPEDVPALTHDSERLFVPGLQDLARQFQMWIGVGIHAAGDKGSGAATRCFNAHLMIDPSGAVVAAYNKTHLFDVDIQGGLTILESRSTVPGQALGAPVSTPLGQVGLLTCYDMRFPEPSLTLRARGAQIIAYPSAFTVKTGLAHWEVLLRARAIETQCYVVAAAQAGKHNAKRESYGDSIIIDPWGTVLARVKTDNAEETTVVSAEIDLAHLESIRAQMPLWEQRRTDLYPELK